MHNYLYLLSLCCQLALCCTCVHSAPGELSLTSFEKQTNLIGVEYFCCSYFCNMVHYVGWKTMHTFRSLCHGCAHGRMSGVPHMIFCRFCSTVSYLRIGLDTDHQWYVMYVLTCELSILCTCVHRCGESFKQTR